MCLEVLEHIPGEHESIVLDNVVRPALEGVVLSWATPGQGGYFHVNEKSAKSVSYTHLTLPTNREV